jgi:alkylation response protein AidB-like acyl-CoA dehydrogenase
VKQRRQFGVPIGSFQAVKHKLVDMYRDLERARALGYFSALCIAEDDDRRTLAAAMAKASAGECQQRIVQDGLQLFGGIGYTWEHDLHLYLRRAKVGELHLGGAAQHRRRVAEIYLASEEPR